MNRDEFILIEIRKGYEGSIIADWNEGQCFGETRAEALGAALEDIAACVRSGREITTLVIVEKA